QENSLRHLPASASDALTATAATLSAQGTALAGHGSGGGTLDNDASTFIGADAVWPSLGGRDRAGAGVIVGVIDTGIWPEHPMLADNGLATPDGGPWACEFGDG